tara:strand:- start:211 stop:483 length:273 start_codon:yes stop_codon:yes gene_type:complete
MRLLTELRYSLVLMYPKVSLISKNKIKLITFERDLNNPFNEGFIIFWEIVKSNNKQLIFKKRLTTNKAQKKLTMLQKEGWIKKNESDKVA